MMMHDTSDTPTGAGQTAGDAGRAAMVADWHAGMRQVDIAAKHGISQGHVSRLIGSAPRFKAQPEPDLAELRARNLLALALINHRRTDEGLSHADVDALVGALTGQWDKAVA